MIQTLFQDIRYAVGLLMRKPGFSVIAILGLSLGIGASTAIFSVVNALLLRGLPYRAPERLVKIRSHNLIDNTAPRAVSYPNFCDWRDQNQVFDALAAYQEGDANLTGHGEPERFHAVQTSYNLFSLLGVNPIRGRGFLPEEDRPGAAPVAIISSGLWQRYFAKDPSVIGASITLDSVATTVVGVLPPGFNFIPGTDIWTPLAMPDDPRARLSLSLESVARLKPGTSLAQASANMDAIATRLAELYPATNKNWSVDLVPLQKDIVGKFRVPLLVLLGAVVLVLLISCVNVANLLLAHAAGRQREITIRMAIGAGRLRIIRQLLTESLILGIAGGGLGLALAASGVSLLTRFAKNIPRADEIGINIEVLAF
ncbi:MAG TPA: ABC transporter permease, partial [Blastocatellia bacterium]|nr:ABC transporter permease [Blastocatellia bacterium]